MDIRKIQNRLRLKGIRIEPDDSAFHLVALNEIVLEGMLRKYNDERVTITHSSMDINAMRALLLEKGIRVAPDDPIFTCLAINEIVLEEIAATWHDKLSTGNKVLLTIQQPGLRAYLKVLVPLALVVVAAFVIDHDWMRRGLALLGAGVLGAGLALLYIDRSERDFDDIAEPKHTDIYPFPHDALSHWPVAEFERVVAKLHANGTALSKRTVEACKAVLVNGTTYDDASSVTGVNRSQIYRGLNLIKDAKESNKKF